MNCIKKKEDIVKVQKFIIFGKNIKMEKCKVNM